MIMKVEFVLSDYAWAITVELPFRPMVGDIVDFDEFTIYFDGIKKEALNEIVNSEFVVKSVRIKRECLSVHCVKTA